MQLKLIFIGNCIVYTLQNELIHGNLPDLSISGLFKKYSSIRVFEYCNDRTAKNQYVSQYLSFWILSKIKANPIILYSSAGELK